MSRVHQKFDGSARVLYFGNRNKEYDIVEFYHRFNKSIKPIQFTFEWIKKSKLTDYNNLPVYIIKFGERIN